MIETIIYVVFGFFIALFVVFVFCLCSWVIFENIMAYRKNPNKIVYLENICDKFFAAWMTMLKILGIVMGIAVVLLLAFITTQVIIMVP